ncbi:MAG: squalene synthase HpnC [Deltaproteobacteria bacterium]|nr:squalene synthase HpnC [Deltaproteobacteria bacterium]
MSIEPQSANLGQQHGGSATMNGPAVVQLSAAHATSSDAEQLAVAYAWCAKLARSHYENFTIASWLMPRAMRRHVHAIYAYARIADDFADEERSIARLDQWQHELELAYAGTPRHPVMVALADTARRYNIPQEPFVDLLTAFRSDVRFQGFETIADLLGYARYSANPVGRLVLYLFGFRDAQRQRLSDLICTGLQLANFWQDVAIDLAKGRIYFPHRDMEQYCVTAEDLRQGKVTAGFVSLMRHEILHAREMLLAGAALSTLVGRNLRCDILMFTGGGLAILRMIEHAGYDVFRMRPKLTRLDYVKLGWHALGGRLQL